MRLTDDQVRIIRGTAHRFLGDKARVCLFGSRSKDDGKGGDIDLYFETDQVLPNRADVICRIYAALVLALGDRKIDVLVKDANTPTARIFEVAARTGVYL
ncbi:nucleotidyltransferase domain-containing protein [Methylomonas sp. SURF-1]|uniref:Nucleotidyltransferase domain-containing protein n=1 Tax=Methylomonas aurea TaxID=2952224 RepID=A0ABT1UDB5_9GAMM|nr:nucleotidyltransferase domain-containing protein [Methylomonas sp. SURF-1]MCQ8180217.1 nucleotidyltransferase domain-containing protein [Methylomonas sp. SURF-1]